MEKTKVGLLYGGNSAEHDVSIMTADSIMENIDKDKFDVTKIFIDKSGKMDEELLKTINVAFLAVHGTHMEDGELQKRLETLGVKYTGAGVESSALNMDKIRTHDVLGKAGIPTTEYVGANASDLKGIKRAANKFGYPIFIKPNNTGSSIGISRVDKEDDLEKAAEDAKKYDEVIIIERAVLEPKEMEVAVLGNDELTISDPGEILANGEVYTYIKKYFDPYKTAVKATGITDAQIGDMRDMAAKAYNATGCVGYARVDFLMSKDGHIVLNEINTLPGFTKISMFPKLMAAAGISYKELITKIINLGLECRR